MARAKKQRKAKPRAKAEETISRFTAQHGDYRPALVVDLSGELGGRKQSMVRLLVNRSVSTVDRWLFEGGPGFEAPQARAIDHVRGLWRRLGHGPRLVANYTGVGGGPGDKEGYFAALHQLQDYERRIGVGYVWECFENVVRHDMPAGKAGAQMAAHSAEQRAHAKACVGFVAGKIAEWRGY
jgi:hypothetical protein